jgi:hypothetical protein
MTLQMPSIGANDAGRAVVGGMAGGMGAGMAGYPVDERRMMGVVGMDARGMGYGARPEPPLPPDASSTLYIEGLPANCTRREVSRILDTIPCTHSILCGFSIYFVDGQF